MQKEFLAYPNKNLGDVIYISDVNDSSDQLKPDVELYHRFPWLEFKNQQLKKKYIYQGRQTEKNHPFYVSFNLSEDSQEGIHQSNEINRSLKAVVDLILNPEPNHIDKKIAEKVEGWHNYMQQKSLFSADKFSVHYGYLLTGIAKPSTRINQIYDSLFTSILKSKEIIRNVESKDEECNSDMELHDNDHPTKKIYNIMKLGWDYKHQSYEYFRFMSRAYQVISKKLQDSNVSLEEIDEMTCMQLFNYNQARVVKYLKQDGKQVQMRDQDYYKYFSAIFKKYHKQILELKPISQSDPNSPRRYEIEMQEVKHILNQFDYRSYLQNQFKDSNLPPESLNRMIEHNRKRNETILNTFPFKTRKEKTSLLLKLQNHNKAIYHRILLLPLNIIHKSKPVHSMEVEDFLILFMRDEELNLANACILEEVVNKIIKKKESSPHRKASMQALKISKENLFYNVYKYHKGRQNYELFKYFSYNPASLIYEQDGLVSPSFQHAMMKLLELDKIPLSLEQELLLCTPSSEINIYEQLEKLVEEYLLCLRNDRLQAFCSDLSDAEGGITFRSSFDEVNLEDNNEIEEQVNQKEDPVIEKESTIRLKLKLLEICMIEFQLSNIKCFYVDPQKNNIQSQNRQPYNAFTPEHYKQLKQYLLLLLIEVQIIKDIEPALLYKRTQTEKPQQQSHNNLKNIRVIKQLNAINYQKYKQYVRYNINRSYFRQVDQKNIRLTIRNIYQEFFINLSNRRWLSEMLRVSLKVFIVLEFLETRLIIMKNRAEQLPESLELFESECRENLQPFRKTFEAISIQEKRENRMIEQDLRWKTMSQSFQKELKYALRTIQNEFNFIKDIYKSGTLHSESAKKAFEKDGVEELSKKLNTIQNLNLIVFCSIYSDLTKLQDNDLETMNHLYKILLCFCCHLKQFQKNQVLRYEMKKFANLGKIEVKIYKFKNVLLTEIVNYLMSNREKYFGNGNNQ